MQENTKNFELYVRGRDYNNKLSPPYYSTVDKNYRFYSNDQWHGVLNNGLPTPVFNILKQIVDFKISSVTSNRTKMQFSVENIADDTQDENEKKLQYFADLISGHTEQKWEKLKMDSMLREVLLDGANSGDMCFYTYWDDSIDTGSTNGVDENGQPVKVMGDFVTEIVDGANVMFGNPSVRNAQKQPYILIAGRKPISELKAKAKANGRPKAEIDSITSDNDVLEQSGDRGKIELDASEGDSSKAMYLIKIWKDKGKVMMNMETRSATIQEATDTGLTLYPIAWGNWDLLKNSYHGQAEVTGLIPNQIMINQMFAMIAYYMRMSAFGKVIYNKDRISSWNNAIGAAIGVDGDVQNAVQQLQPGQMNNFIMTVIEKAISYTKEIAGVNDAALGNMSPRNTSAIVALQKQTAIPLENVKGRKNQLIEDLGYIWLDFIVNKYGVERQVSYTEENKLKVGSFTGANFKNVPFNLKVDVGDTGFYSEMANIQTLDNLLQQEKITMVQYLDRIPSSVIPKKTELINEIKAQNQAMEEKALADSEQSQQLEQQTQQAEQAKKQLTYEQLAQFFETLAPEVQEELKKLPDNQMEVAIQKLYEEQQKGTLNQMPQQIQ